MAGQILSLRICYIVPISEKGNAISTLYLFWRKAYQSYITLENEGGRPQKDMEQWYHSSISGYITFAKSTITVLYLDISLLQKALSQCYTLLDIGISRYGTRLIFLLMIVFTVEEYRRPVPFCPKRSSLLSPRRLRAKYTHRTNQRFVLCVFRPAGSKFTQAWITNADAFAVVPEMAQGS